MSKKRVHEKTEISEDVEINEVSASKSYFNSQLPRVRSKLIKIYNFNKSERKLLNINKENINNALLLITHNHPSLRDKLGNNQDMDKISYFNYIINGNVETLFEFIFEINIINERKSVYFEATVYTNIQCPKCGLFTVVQREEQTKSLDEGADVFEKCTSRGCPYRKLIK